MSEQLKEWLEEGEATLRSGTTRKTLTATWARGAGEGGGVTKAPKLGCPGGSGVLSGAETEEKRLARENWKPRGVVVTARDTQVREGGRGRQ